MLRKSDRGEDFSQRRYGGMRTRNDGRAPATRGAVCDERLNIHGVQGTTHFATQLIILNGLLRRRLGFACRQNVFSNVARANPTITVTATPIEIDRLMTLAHFDDQDVGNISTLRNA